MTGNPPGVLRVMWVLARMRFRRRLNLLGGQFRRKKKVEPGAPPSRSATPSKRRGGAILLGFLGVLFFWQGIFASWGFLGRLCSEIEDARVPRELIRISSIGHGMLLEAEADLKEMAESKEVFKRSLEERREDVFRDLERDLSWSHVHDFKGEREEREARAKEIVESFRAGGVSRFRPKDSGFLGARFPSSEGRDIMVRGIGLLLLGLALCQLFSALGSANQDLGAVSWTLEWLFTFPVPARALFLAQIFEHALLNTLGWFLTMPFLLVAFWAAGFGYWAIPFGLAAGGITLVILGACTVFIETWLRSALSRSRIQNLQALLGVAGTLLFFAVVWVALTPELPRGYLSAAEASPQFALWNPFSLPALVLDGGGSALAAAAALVLCAALFPWLSALGSERLVRAGLVSAGAGASTGRRTARPRQESRALLRGIVAKEALVLVRDRNRLVQTLVIPMLIVGFQIALNPAILGGVASRFEHIAALAFGAGAYMLLFNAMNVLSLEGGALWILYTLPRALHSMLFQKTFLWCALASSFTLAILCAGSLAGSGAEAARIGAGFLALGGVFIHAFIASGLGVLATHPLETEPTRRVDQKYIYLYLAVSALYAPAIYIPSVWSRVGQVLLSSILAFAVWQKAREHLPFLLDPTDAPPPRLSLMHGILTASGYFGLQAFSTALFIGGGVHLGVALLLSALGAGLAAATVSLCALCRIPGFLAAAGLQPRPGLVGKSWLLGIAGGLAAAAVGFLYVELAGTWEPLRTLQEEALALRDQARALDPNMLAAISLLAVFVAPASEEYIFRGLIFQGMRRSMGALPAILLSAAVFSIFHAPYAAPPVFVLGVIAAWARERTGYLLAPFLVHTLYNLAMVVAEEL